MMKELQEYWKHALLFTCFGTLCIVIPILIHRGIHGHFGIGFHGITILFLGLLPFFVILILRQRQIKLWWCPSNAVSLLLSACLVLYYLSSNGLWCAQHPSVTHELCAKLLQFASFAASSNVTSWWLTMGDLLAVHRGLDMPIHWEHDIDICITPGQFPLFEEALKSNVGHFKPEAESITGKKPHWYLPIDMAKLGLSNRDGEGVNVDIWTCPQLTGNITRVLYCNGLMNVPSSLEDRNTILTNHYGNYSEVKYAHHNLMCRIWNAG
ncbi:uncharacterized protein LOC144666042 [Oculina patagonica]